MIGDMNTLRLLIGVSAIAVAQVGWAGPVNKCTDVRGQVVMTERPCGNPATEAGSRQPIKISVESIQADDIFRARKKLNRTGHPLSNSEAADLRPDPPRPAARDTSR